MDYSLVYFHHGLTSRNKPPIRWLWEVYKALDRRYKKNLKSLYLVHPTNFIRVVWNFFKPIIRCVKLSTGYIFPGAQRVRLPITSQPPTLVLRRKSPYVPLGLFRRHFSRPFKGKDKNFHLRVPHKCR